MRLLPREQDRLLLFLAAELARKRRATGAPTPRPRRPATAHQLRHAVGVTSHFHFFETNRALRFDRAAAWGMRLAIAPGEKVFFAPGEPREVFLVPFGGARVIRGHAGLVDGPLDADGARDAALALARERGYRGA